MWKASRMTEASLSRMVEIAVSKKIPINYTREDLEEDFKGAFGEEV